MVCSKLLFLGQTILKPDFESFWNSLLAASTDFELERVLGPISKEQISHALQSNEVKYNDGSLRSFFSFFLTTLHFVWPAILYTHAAIILLQILALGLLRKTNAYRIEGVSLV